MTGAGGSGDKAYGYRTEVDYPIRYYRELNPNIQALALTTAGFVPPDPGAAYTYIELGCGYGLSTLIHAAANPQSRFIATDINPVHTDFMSGVAAAAGLDNVAFLPLAFADMQDADLPKVNIITMQGVWSWVNQINRDLILAFARSHLADGGVIYVSYNAMPGMAPVMPLGELMRTAFFNATGTVPQRVDVALATARQARDVGGVFYQANPLVSQYIDDIQSLERNYLAHEYFNADWWSFYVGEVARPMANAGLTLGPQARILDNLDALAVPQKMREFLAAVADPLHREERKDFLLNRQFRRDLYIKQPTRITDTAAALATIPFAGAVSPANVPRVIAKTLVGEIKPDAALTTAIVTALNSGAASAAELSAGPLASVPLMRILDTLLTLAALGAAEPALPRATFANRKARTDRLNTVLRERALAAGGIQANVSPVTGGAVGLSRMEQIFLLARARGDNPVATVTRALPQENPAEVAQAYERFVAGPVPLLETLGIG